MTVPSPAGAMDQAAALAQCFRASISPTGPVCTGGVVRRRGWSAEKWCPGDLAYCVQADIKNAEAQLKTLQSQPQYTINVLRVRATLVVSCWGVLTRRLP